VFWIVGNNGAGKTTLSESCLDLVEPHQATVLIDGHDVSKQKPWKANTGAYLDEHMLLTYLTPDE